MQLAPHLLTASYSQLCSTRARRRPSRTWSLTLTLPLTPTPNPNQYACETPAFKDLANPNPNPNPYPTPNPNSVRVRDRPSRTWPLPLPLTPTLTLTQYACETPAFKDLADCLAAAEDAGDASQCMARYRDLSSENAVED